MKVLVTGGVRSGKSRHAESLLAGHEQVLYVATGPSQDDDPDWTERIAAHRARRPATWTTLETGDLVAALSRQEPVLVDCLGNWLTRALDERALWDATAAEATAAVEALLSEVVAALHARTADAVVVTNEVGLGVVPVHRSGRLFRDLLGIANQRVAEACDEVHLAVAGRVLVL